MSSGRSRPHETRVQTSSLDKKVGRWQRTRAIEDASDLVDAACHFGDRTIARDAADQILTSTDIVAGVRLSALRYLSEGSKLPISDSTTQSKWEEISTYKRRLVNHPRDSISAVEISRLYALSGQVSKSIKYMDRALMLNPDNRFVLRCASRLFTHLGDHERALHILWASNSVRYDPWVQAAEVAVADQMNRASRWGHKSLVQMLGSPHLRTDFSELAIGLASVEQKNGGKRKIIRTLIENALASPTENALAQAVWMDERGGYSLDVTGLLIETPMASEALALNAYDHGDYERAIIYTSRWMEDQPFSKRPYLLGAYCATLYLNDFPEAERFSKAGLRVYPGDPQLSNALLVASAYQGKLTQARECLEVLGNFKDDINIAPFFYAALGLIAFREGRISEGRRQYQAAAEYSRDSEDRNLTFNAITFWLEQEAYASSIDLEAWNGITLQVDEAVNKLKDYRGKEIRRAWFARRSRIDDLVRQAALPEPFHSELKSADDDIRMLLLH